MRSRGGGERSDRPCRGARPRLGASSASASSSPALTSSLALLVDDPAGAKREREGWVSSVFLFSGFFSLHIYNPVVFAIARCDRRF